MAEIPKPFSQQGVSLGWPKTLLSVSAVIFILSLAFYFVLAGYERATTRQSKDLDREIQDIANAVSPGDVQKLITLDSQIKSLKEILPKHRYLSRVLDFVEVNTLPQTRLTNLSVDATRQKIVLQGVAQDSQFISLQAAAYEKSDMAQQFAIKTIGGATGGLSFIFEVIFKDILILPR
ncbi:MAG: hypothetical protein ACK4NX_00610 [Candidatus Paceibacteria bacterium]